MWHSILKVQELTSRHTLDSNIKDIPEEEKLTCLEEFNKIVDWIFSEINRIEASSSPLWNTQTDDGPNVLHADHGHFMTWTYYFRNANEYSGGRTGYYKHALINSEHICWHAEDEESACSNLKNLAKASVKVERELRETSQDNFPQLEYSMRLNTFDVGDNWMSSGVSGSIQMDTDVINVKEHPYILGWSDEDKTKYIPAINKVLKEHDNLYKQIIQKSKAAVNKLNI